MNTTISFFGLTATPCKASRIIHLCNLPSTKFKLLSYNEKFVPISPPQTLTLVTLAELASRYLKMTPLETFRLARSLYAKGYITYPTALPSHFTEAEYDVLVKEATLRFGVENVNSTLPLLLGHERTHDEPSPIRPVFINNTMVNPGADLEWKERKLFDIVTKNVLATVMLPGRRRISEHLFEATMVGGNRGVNTASFDIGDRKLIGRCTFNSTKTEIIELGFLRALNMSSSSNQTTCQSNYAHLIGQAVFPVRSPERNKKFCFWPHALDGGISKYTPLKLISELIQQGCVGKETPLATMKTIEFLEKRGYAKTNLTAWSRNRFMENVVISPTRKGFFVDRFLNKYFDFAVNPDFSSTIQRELDKIGNGQLEKSEILIHSLVYGSNETSNSATSDMTKVLQDGLFKIINHRLGSIDVSQPTHDTAPVEHPLKTTRIGTDPTSSLPLYVKKSKFGNYLQLGKNSSVSDAHTIKRFPLPSWISPSFPIECVKEALEFTKLPRVICRHPSTNEPIMLLISKGLLWLQVGEKRSAASAKSKVALEPGIYPSDVSVTMALNRLCHS